MSARARPRPPRAAPACAPRRPRRRAATPRRGSPRRRAAGAAPARTTRPRMLPAVTTAATAPPPQAAPACGTAPRAPIRATRPGGLGRERVERALRRGQDEDLRAVRAQLAQQLAHPAHDELGPPARVRRIGVVAEQQQILPGQEPLQGARDRDPVGVLGQDAHGRGRVSDPRGASSPGRRSGSGRPARAPCGRCRARPRAASRPRSARHLDAGHPDQAVDRRRAARAGREQACRPRARGGRRACCTRAPPRRRSRA